MPRPGVEEVGDRVAAVAAEIALADLDPGRRLAALVFGAQQLALDVGDQRFGLAGRGGGFGDRQLALDQRLEDPVEHRIRRQAVLVLLVGAKLGRGRLVDHPLGHHRPVGAERAARLVGVAPARQREDRRLVGVLEHRIAARHVAVERGIADAHLALVAGGQQHLAARVAERHQRDHAQPRLDVLGGDALADRRASRRTRRRPGSIEMTSWRQPSIFAQASASSRLVCEVYLLGIITQWTLSGPSASTATAADSALSMPPDRPRITPGKPFAFDIIAKAHHHRQIDVLGKGRDPALARTARSASRSARLPSAWSPALPRSRAGGRPASPSPLTTKLAPSNTSSSCPPTRLR